MYKNCITFTKDLKNGGAFIVKFLFLFLFLFFSLRRWVFFYPLNSLSRVRICDRTPHNAPRDLKKTRSCDCKIFVLFHEKSIWKLYAILPNPVNTRFSGYLLTVPYWRYIAWTTGVCTSTVVMVARPVARLDFRRMRNLRKWTFWTYLTPHSKTLFLFWQGRFSGRVATPGYGPGCSSEYKQPLKTMGNYEVFKLLIIYQFWEANSHYEAL